MVILYIIPVAVFITSVAAELLHANRIKKVARLAFGPKQRPTTFGAISPWIRAGMLSLLAWSITALFVVDSKVHRTVIKEVPVEKKQHLILVLDVSPSMRLVDSGVEGKESRLKRASAIVKSLFARINQDYLHLSVIATYNGAMPVVIDTRDLELIDNMLNDLPMHFAFKPGKTQLFEGLTQAAVIAEKWKKDSTTVLLISDGETVPAAGMPVMPPAVSDVLVVGVGDPSEGKFINGEHSRQNVPTLQQIATRLGGSYHNGNKKHVPSDTLRGLSSISKSEDKNELSLREYALIAFLCSTTLLAALPLFLSLFGTPSRHTSRTLNTTTQQP